MDAQMIVLMVSDVLHARVHAHKYCTNCGMEGDRLHKVILFPWL